MKLSALIPLPLLLAGMPFAAAQSVPSTIPFQGRLMESGANLTTTGFFKFALLDTGPEPDITLWSNDNSSINGAEPTTAESVGVTDGYYSVQLGGSGMTSLSRDVLSASSGAAVKLRVWFSKTSGGTFQQFTPDFTPGSAPYALDAHSVQGIAASGLLRLEDLDTIRDSLRLTSAEGLSIGATSSNDLPAALNIQSDTGHWEADTTPDVTIRKDGVGGSNDLNGATSVCEITNFSSPGFFVVAVASATDDSISVFERAGTALNLMYVIKDGLAGVDLLNGVSDIVQVPTSTFQFGASRATIAAVSPLDDGLTIFELTPTGFFVIAEVVDGQNGFTALDGARRLAVNSARTLAITAPGESAVQFASYSSSGILTAASEIRDGTGGFNNLAGVSGVAMEALRAPDRTLKHVATVSASADTAVTSILLDDPSAPVLGESFVFTNLASPSAVAMDDGFVVVASSADGKLSLLSLETTGNLTSLQTLATDGSNGFTRLAGVDRVALAGRLVIASSPIDHAITLIDTAEIFDPRLVAEFVDATAPFTDLAGTAGVAFRAGNTATNNHGSTPVAIDLFITSSSDSSLTWVRNAAEVRRVALATSGSIGIGTHLPAADLEIQDVNTSVDGDSNATIRLGTHGNGKAILQLGEYNSGVFSGWDLGFDGTVGSITFGHQGFAQPAGTKFTLDRNGNAVLTGTLTQGSDRARKENIVPADPAAILEKVAALPVAEWSYIGDGGTRHVGPMSQDFRAAFGLGATEKGIASVDADGIALAAIKALKAELDALKQDNAALRARVEQLEAK